jgi:hypothetical protein
MVKLTRPVPHPLVGAWLVEPDTAHPSAERDQTTVFSDGTIRDVSKIGHGTGVWRSTGASSADVTTRYPMRDPAGAFLGFLTVRGQVTVAPGGMSFAATYTVEVPTAPGVTTGERGAVDASGTRLTVEPMGKPVGPWP